MTTADIVRANKAQINDWLWVGNCESCPDPEHEMVVHIFRHDTGEKQERCCVYEVGGTHPPRRNLRVNYKDGEAIDPSNLKNIDVVVSVLKERKRSTLVHCHAGMCRSPTIAIYLLCMVDGMHPYDAHALVTRKIYEQRAGVVCNVVYKPFKQVVRLWEVANAS